MNSQRSAVDGQRVVDRQLSLLLVWEMFAVDC
jgi:hypothetical protein